MPSSLIPTLRYRDAPAAIDFLCDAFGFRRHMVVEGETEETIAHAQLVLGSGMLMIGSARDDEYGSLLTTVADAGKPTGSLYVVVPDVDAHAERARERGAEIVKEPVDQDYGGRLYTCRDPEGNLWNFGSYDPWVEVDGSENGRSRPRRR